MWARGFAARFGGAAEVVSARTAYTTEFANPDGSSTVRVFDEVGVCSDDGAGGLRPVDTSLSRRADGRFGAVRGGGGGVVRRVGGRCRGGAWQLGAGVSVGFGVAGGGGGAGGGVEATWPGTRRWARMRMWSCRRRRMG